MTDSLRDQLLGLGFKPPVQPERKPKSGPRSNAGPTSTDGRRPRPGQRGPKPERPGAPQRHPAGRKSPARREEGEIELARAYAIRAQREKDERIEAERLKQEQARLRREAKARLADLLKDQVLNDPAADIARHFEYGGKIKRIYVTAAQLQALNAGELGVVQQDGRYLLVNGQVLAQAEAVFAPSIALKVDPSAPQSEDPYADPQYQVPDDLVW